MRTALLLAAPVLGIGLASQPAPAQTPSSPDSTVFICYFDDPTPVLIGGLDSLLTQVVYPPDAIAERIEGAVFVQFIVDEDGHVQEPTVVRSPDPRLSSEAIRVVRLARFTPGIQRGEPVKVRYTLPIRFSVP